MKKVFIFSGMLLFLFLFVISCQESQTKLFERLAKEQTRRCPIQIEEFIVLDSVKYLPEENIYRYFYTLSGEYDDIGYIQENKQALEKELTNGVINSIDLKAYKDFNTILEYIYFSSSSSSEILKISVGPQEYK